MNFSIEPDCQIIASYNLPHTKPAIYCATHAKEGMVNNTLARCKHAGCEKSASFGINGVRDYCSEHKPIDATLAGQQFCKQNDCKKFPTYGFKNGSKEYCPEHKLVGMINLKHIGGV